MGFPVKDIGIGMSIQLGIDAGKSVRALRIFRIFLMDLGIEAFCFLEVPCGLDSFSFGETGQLLRNRRRIPSLMGNTEASHRENGDE